MTFNFTTKLEDGDVIVFWQYEQDDHGIYNSEVLKVVFNDMDVTSILSEETLNELDSKAEKVYLERFND
ncbi:hypothetical protein UFOVP70_5 [uncultured Caudovirales phage]|uniref:Uncharacterized protein n=1 Tax=uncultured Caudovirales phage TaxID=2100421 RepID=A0A6J5KW44_9CAUD|nr:hypothetical protein UFOVP70_5 [uncultured Caudovirales phage]